MADRRRAFESVSKKRYEPERREVPGKRPTLASGGFHLARWVGALSRNANGNAARLTCQDGGAAISSGVQYPLFYNLRQCCAVASNSFKYCCQTAAQVCVPWPWVWSETGINTNRPLRTRLISRSAMPNSGGLMKSSAELMNITGALIVSNRAAGS